MKYPECLACQRPTFSIGPLPSAPQAAAGLVTGLELGGLRPRLWVKSGQVPAGARGGADISPVRVRNSAWIRGLGVIVWCKGGGRAPPWLRDPRDHTSGV